MPDITTISRLISWVWPSWSFTFYDAWLLLYQLVVYLADTIIDFVGYIVAFVPDPPKVDWYPYQEYLRWANAFVPMPYLMSCLGFYLSWLLIWSLLRIVLKLVWSG